MTPPGQLIQLGVRISEFEDRNVSALAKHAGLSKAGVMRELIPLQPEILHAIAALVVDSEGKKLGDVIERLIADGLCALMIEDGLEPWKLQGLKPDAMGQSFLIWRDLRAMENGREPTYEASNAYHLECPPEGGFWEKTGRMGLQIVADSDRLTPDGVEHVKERFKDDHDDSDMRWWSNTDLLIGTIK